MNICSSCCDILYIIHKTNRFLMKNDENSHTRYLELRSFLTSLHKYYVLTISIYYGIFNDETNDKLINIC